MHYHSLPAGTIRTQPGNGLVSFLHELVMHVKLNERVGPVRRGCEVRSGHALIVSFLQSDKLAANVQMNW